MDPQDAIERDSQPYAVLGILELWSVLRRRKLIVIFGLIVGTALALLYHFQATVKYESTSQVLVMKKNSPSLPAQGGEGVEFEGRVLEDLLATHMQLLTSPRVVKKALSERKLAALPSIVNAAGDNQDPVDYVIKNLEVRRGGEGQARTAHVLNVSFRHRSPEDCASVLNAVIESYQNFLGDTFQDVSTEAITLIDQAKDELAQELEKDEAAYLEFLEKAPLLSSRDGDLNIHQRRLGVIEASLSETRLKYAQTRSRLEMIEGALKKNGSPASDLDGLALIDESHVSRLSLLVSVEKGDGTSEQFLSTQPARTETARTEYERLLELMLKEKSLLMDRGPDHPEVQQTRQNIEAVKSFLEQNSGGLGVLESKARLEPGKLLSSYQVLLRHDLTDLERRQNELVALSAEESALAKGLVTQEVQAQTLRGRLERKQELFDTVVARLREINLAKDYGGYITEVISPVKLGEQVWPMLVLLLPLGGVLGLGAGAGLAFAVDKVDTTFRSPDEVQRTLGVPVMAHLPHLHFKNGKAPKHVSAAGTRVAQAVVAHLRPKSREAEAFRVVRTSLYFAARAGTQKVIQITSPDPADGKSTLAANLAVSLAQSGKKVLLVDADMRRPKQHALFGIETREGLSSVLVGVSELPDAIHDTEVANLRLLPCGVIPPDPAELLALPKFQELIDVLRGQYDFVILDTPPLLAVSDAMSIAARADGVLLTLRIRKNGRANALRAKELLTSHQVKLLGLVVNGVDQQGDYGYGYYGYGKGGNGYYGSGDESDAYFSEAGQPAADVRR